MSLFSINVVSFDSVFKVNINYYQTSLKDRWVEKKKLFEDQLCYEWGSSFASDWQCSNKIACECRSTFASDLVQIYEKIVLLHHITVNYP